MGKRNMKLRLFILCCFGLVLGFAQNGEDDLYLYDDFKALSQENIFKTEGYYNWGSSIIKERDGKYHLFYSRWKKEYGFHGWLTHSEIAHATSKSPAGPWKYKETVLLGAGQGNWDAITAHNPKIKYFEGKYYLYYIATNMGGKDYTEEELVETAKTGYSHPNWKILRPNQRTGVAVSNSLNGPWSRMDKPLVEPSGPITTLNVNPAIDKGKDGKYYLIIKGDKPNEKKFIRNQAVAVAEHPDGPFEIKEKPVIDYMDTEDMSIWYDENRDRFYGVFHAHNYIGLVTSENGTDWEKANEFVLKNKEILMEDGTVIGPDRMERPFVYHEGGEPKVLSVAVKKGEESYAVFIPIIKNKSPVPNKRQLAWQEAELGVVFHYDLHVFDGVKYGQGNNRIDPVEDYQIFNPEKLDTDQWVKAAKDAGAKFAILTATHETGFALFQSKVNPYSVKALNWKDGKGDVVADFVASCRKYGIKPGIYLGIRWNSFLGVHDFKVNGEGDFKKNRQQWYNRMVEGMIKEICTNYGELFEIWFDGGADHPKNGAPDVLPIVRQYQPNCLFYHNGQLAEARWGGSESGTVAYPNWSTFPYRATGAGESAKKNIADNNFQLLKQGDVNGKFWVPAMADAPLRGYNGRHEWFWEPGDEDHIFPLENLVDMYYKSVGRNATLIMGLTPDPDGLLPEPDVQRLKEWGEEINRRFSNPLASTKGKGKVLELKLKESLPVNHIIIQEDIAMGERIRNYEIEGYSGGRWITLVNGESIGNKRIEKFDTIKLSRLRIKIIDSDGLAQIKDFSAYFVAEKDFK
ncbi:alpha-L-fucosidase [Arenibacter algicola]